jgi:tyrosyl-DNA phosphodiesterase 2
LRHCHHRIPIAVFDAASNRWTAADVAAGVDRDELTVATFNIWFDGYFADDRHRAIADILARDMPDVMVFQEVTPAALDVLSAQPWIRDHYLRAAAVNGLGNYGMLMLSRLPIIRASYTRLPTRLARGFLRAEFTINGRTLVVCSVHLESGRAALGLRARQLRRIFRALRGVDNALLLGDFNMRDTENERISPPWVDVWPALRPHDDGFTEDTSINLMRLDSKNKHRQVRFDRVLFKGTGWAAKSIDLLGTQPISSAHPRVFPSDHFGVRCRFIRQDSAVGEATRLRRLRVRVPSLRVRPARRSGWLRR